MRSSFFLTAPPSPALRQSLTMLRGLSSRSGWLQNHNICLPLLPESWNQRHVRATTSVWQMSPLRSSVEGAITFLGLLYLVSSWACSFGDGLLFFPLRLHLPLLIPPKEEGREHGRQQGLIKFRRADTISRMLGHWKPLIRRWTLLLFTTQGLQRNGSACRISHPQNSLFCPPKPLHLGTWSPLL